MRFFGKFIKAGIDTVSLPIAIIKDIATLGGAITGTKRPYTMQKLRDIGEHIQEAKDEL
jgi:hypothetical protein